MKLTSLQHNNILKIKIIIFGRGQAEGTRNACLIIRIYVHYAKSICESGTLSPASYNDNGITGLYETTALAKFQSVLYPYVDIFQPIGEWFVYT